MRKVLISVLFAVFSAFAVYAYFNLGLLMPCFIWVLVILGYRMEHAEG